MRNILYVLVGLLLIVGGVLLVRTGRNDKSPIVNEDTEARPEQFTFSTPKKSAHYESNTPEHGSVLAAPPINIVLDFNFDLAKPSSITISKDGAEFGVGETTIDSNKLSMRRDSNLEAPDGLYKVTYDACWPDGSCHDGYFEFAIDRSLATTYIDMTGRQEVTINMSEVMFKPQDIKISAGTKVTWINDESVEHYINTETHPAHTYFPLQNSRALKKGETFSTTFSSPGIYPYHCSAHADVMTGNILVQD
jgi:plastocyanin/methionine-rich copper-binding protein CopC